MFRGVQVTNHGMFRLGNGLTSQNYNQIAKSRAKYWMLPYKLTALFKKYIIIMVEPHSHMCFQYWQC